MSDLIEDAFLQQIGLCAVVINEQVVGFTFTDESASDSPEVFARNADVTKSQIEMDLHDMDNEDLMMLLGE